MKLQDNIYTTRLNKENKALARKKQLNDVMPPDATVIAESCFAISVNFMKKEFKSLSQKKLS